jgi:hypothetical protein
MKLADLEQVDWAAQSEQTLMEYTGHLHRANEEVKVTMTRILDEVENDSPTDAETEALFCWVDYQDRIGALWACLMLNLSDRRSGQNRGVSI